MSRERWRHCSLTLNVAGEIVYGRSRFVASIDILDQLAPPTDDEIASGNALRTHVVTAEYAWTNSFCTRCDLWLPLHGEARKESTSRRLCRVARKRQKELERVDSTDSMSDRVRVRDDPGDAGDASSHRAS